MKTIYGASLMVMSLLLLTGAGCGSSTAPTTPNTAAAPGVSIAVGNIAVGGVYAFNNGDPAVGLVWGKLAEMDASTDSYTVKNTDGSDSYASKEQFIYSVPQIDLGYKVGDQVLAASALTGFFWTGKVAEVKTGNYTVAWDNGQTQEDVPVGKFLPINLVDPGYIIKN